MKQNQKLYEEIDLLNNVANYPKKIIIDPLRYGESDIYIKYKQLNMAFLSDFLREYEHFYLLLYGLFNDKIQSILY